MKTIYFFILVFLLLFSASLPQNSFAQNSHSGGTLINKDSLLFDGEDATVTLIPVVKGNDLCHGKITYTSGDTQFKTTEKEIVNNGVCMQHLPDDTVLSTKYRNKNPGDFMHTGDEISTGANGRAEIEMGDGSIVRVGPNSHFTLDCSQDFEKQTTTLKEVLGEIWSDVIGAINSDNSHQIETFNATAGVRGTKFEIISSKNETTIKLYEGSISAKNKKYSGNVELSSSDKDALMQKLQKLTSDFQAGKISMEELQKKSQEIASGAGDDIHTVILKPGQMTIIRGDTDPTQPTSFSEDNSSWYAPKNFGK